MWDWGLPTYRVIGRSVPTDVNCARRADVTVPSAANHQIAVTTAVTRATGSTTTVCAASSHSPGSDAVISFGRGRPPASCGRTAREPTVAIRHRSRSANHRAGARAPAAGRDLSGRSKPTVATHRPPSTSSRPTAAITGAVSRYSDSTRARFPVRKTNLAP